MTYELHEEYNSKNYTPGNQANAVWGQGNRDVQGIVIHHWGVPGQNFWDVNNFLCTNNSPTSAHYVVQDGLVSCIVSPNDSAWHAGNAWANSHLIGLELRPEATAGDYRTAAELIAQIRKDFGRDLPLTPHNKWQATACPGVWDLAKLDRMAREVAAGTAPKPAAAKPAAAKPAAATNAAYTPDPHWKVERNETLGQVAAWAKTTVAALAKFNGIKNINVITVGERIWAPTAGHDTWIVDPGDTLAKVASWYTGRGHTVTVEQLKNANGINNPATETSVGLRLIVP